MAVSILDLIFPKRCVNCQKFGSYICRDCLKKVEFVDKPICPICQRQAVGGKTHPGCSNRLSLDGLIVGMKYRGPVKIAVKKIKYRWVRDIEETLGELLVKNMWKFDFPQGSILVPIPLHSKRKRWRGFNQAELLANYFAKKFHQKASVSLSRIIDTKPQVGLKKDGRIKNIKGAFIVNGDVRGKELILVDDVFTSGATMMEACRVLKRVGAKSVWAMTLALG